MAVELLNDVPEISWSKNPIQLDFKSNMSLEREGERFIVYIGFAYSLLPNWNSPQEGEILPIEMYGLIHRFTFKNDPSIGYNELPVYKHDVSIDAYFNELKVYFESNSYVDSNYFIEVTEKIEEGDEEIVAEASPYLRFTSKEKSDQANISFLSWPSGLVMWGIAIGISPIHRKNLKIYAELWVYNGLNKTKVISANMPTDVNGLATWDISIPLHNYATLNANTQVADSGIVKYFVNFSDVYGIEQTVGNYLKTSDKYVLYGGVPNSRLGEHVFQSLVKDGVIKWLTTCYLNNVSLTSGQEYLLTLFNPIVSYLNVSVCFNLHYDNSLSKEIIVDTVDLISNTKIYVNPLKDILFSFYPDNLLYWEIYLKHDNKVLSQKATFQFDTSYSPFLRQLKYFNSYGAFSYLNINGKGNNVYELESIQAEILNSSVSGKIIDISNAIRNKEVLRTGYKTKQEIEAMRDFFLSNEKYLKVGDRWQGIIVKTTTIKEFEDGNNLYALEFEIEWSENDYVWGYK